MVHRCRVSFTFSVGIDIDSGTLAGVVLFILFLQLMEIGLLFTVCTRLGFSPRDVVCILFCATHKSLTLGMGHVAGSNISTP